MSAMFQEPVHYNATVEENIALDDLCANRDKKVAAAAGAACVDEIIRRLPRGYKNLLGKWFVDGAELSVGEWQRLAIARALYPDPDILILDEATASLDTQTEQSISRTLERLRGQKTLILVAHRLSTVRSCDRLLFMERGSIADEGDFTSLYQRNARFREMVYLSRPEPTGNREH